MRKILLLILLVFLYNKIVFAKDNGFTVYSESKMLLNISHIEMLEDPNNSFSFEQVLKSQEFRLISQNIPNLGISKSSFWLKFEISNITNDSNLNLILEQPNLDEVELYILSPNNNEYQLIRKGEFEAFHHKNYQHPNYIFDISIPENESRAYLLKIKSNEQIFLPLFISSVKSTIEYISKQDTLFSFYAGIILVMLLYNIFIYFTVRDNSYLYYAFYILFILLTQIALKGYHFKYLMPDFPEWANKSVTLFPSIVGIAAIEFIKNFLRTKEKVPLLNKVATLLEGVFLISMTLLFLDHPTKSFQIMQLNTTISSLLVLFIGYKVLKKGYRPAKFFLLAWSILCVGALIYVLKDYGILPYNNFTNYTLPAGSAMEVILLSFALADRINILKAEKEEAQASELKAQKDKKDTLKKKAEELEEEVKIATLELKLKNQRLETAYRQLELAKSELIQKEKISALMLMAAGTSHEFNNANTTIQLAFDVIDINTKFHKEYIDKLHEILPEAKNIEPQLEGLEDYKEEIKYEFISKDIQDAMRKAQNGLEKLALNTKKLKDFSKIDNEGWIYADINQDLIDLSDLWNSNLGAIQLKLDLNKDIPRLLCNGQMVNDCFKSILQNAIEAIKEKDIPEKEGLITIATNVFEGSVVISFTDNGIGMSEEISSRAFDFFFTTKGVKKTGTSLTIVKTTLITHNGHVEMDTKINEGTTIRLIIPVKTK